MTASRRRLVTPRRLTHAVLQMAIRFESPELGSGGTGHPEVRHAGSLWAALRQGAPPSALAGALGFRGLAVRLAPIPEPVLAPSLNHHAGRAAA
jgi:hypothetical protein